MPIPVYVSTGTFITRKNGRNFRLVESVGPMLHADGFEFLMFDSWNDRIREIRSFLKQSGASFPVMHPDKAIGDALSVHGAAGEEEAVRILSRDLETALAIGAKKMVLHLWNGPEADKRFDEILPAARRLFELSQSAGVELTVENVISAECLALQRLKALSEFDSRFTFTYDTKMAHLKNENALLEKDEWKFLFSENKVTHLHVNDSSVSRHSGGRLTVLHMGEGDVDFISFFRHLKNMRYNGTATVESTSVNDDGTCDTEKLNRTLDRVREGLNP